MKILTAELMRRADQLTVEKTGISYSMLMETAGQGVFSEIEKYLTSADGGEWNFVIFGGKGNNGGDGAVVARRIWLHRLGKVKFYLVGRCEEMKGEARANVEILRSIASLDSSIEWNEVVTDIPDLNASRERLVVIDALFGTGLRRRVEGIAASIIKLINQLREEGAAVIAVDLPSGLLADSNEAVEPHVRADLTVALTAPKIANIQFPAAGANGELRIVRIGTPDVLLDQVVMEGWKSEGTGNIETTEIEQIRNWLKRSQCGVTAHKGNAGRVMVLAGTIGRTGAAALAAGAALRSGAGLVMVGTPVSALPLLVSQCDSEVMTLPLPETIDGGFSAESMTQLESILNGWDALAIGPGIRSDSVEARSFVQRVIEQRSQPVVIDADGLNALAPWPAELKGSSTVPIVITPHPGEMARLLSLTTAEIEQYRIAVARQLAMQQHLIVVLKGAGTIIADPTGRVVVNGTGNEGMATAGAGDVLTGIVAGLLARRSGPAMEAVIAGVWLHGMAGDLAAATIGRRAMIASDIRDHLYRAIIYAGGTAV